MPEPIRTVRLTPGRAPEEGHHRFAGTALTGPPVSCLMITRGGDTPARFAIDCWRRQTYRTRELLVVCDRPASPVAALVTELADPAIRLIAAPPATLGELRNVAVAHAAGELLCQWDDDDLSAPDRLALMVEMLRDHEVAAVFLERWTLWWPARRRIALSGRRIWEGSILARRDALPAYPAQPLGEDLATVRRLCAARPVLTVDRPDLYCYVVHGANSYAEPHFTDMFGWASAAVPEAGYDRALAALAATLPVEAYARSLA